MRLQDAITDVPGIRVGQRQDERSLTGCSVVLCEQGAVAGVDQRGGAPGTRETDLLRPMHLVQRVHAVLLTGGSAFGLEAAAGVVRYLEERRIGFDTGVARVPIVPAAVIFDLHLGRADVRPDAVMAYAACLEAGHAPPAEGNVGAGCGASVGKIFGLAGAVKSGVGTASAEFGPGIVVNPLGDVIDPASGTIVAGARPVRRGPIRLGGTGIFADTLQVMRGRIGRAILGLASHGNTVIGVVATNARLTKEQANFVADMAHDGLARVVRPAHTLLDGDTLFALSTGSKRSDVSLVGAMAAEVVSRAILRAVLAAAPAGGLPSAQSLL
jgi:L-aminopeptidase/D-esterase-like protein